LGKVYEMPPFPNGDLSPADFGDQMPVWDGAAFESLLTQSFNSSAAETVIPAGGRSTTNSTPHGTLH